MVDFKKIMEERKAAGKKLLEEAKDKPTVIVKKLPSELTRLKHMIAEHAGNMSEWENNFCLDNHNYLVLQAKSENGLSKRAREKLGEIEADYCGSDCEPLS